MRSKYGTLAVMDPNVAKEGAIPKHILEQCVYVYVFIRLFMYVCMLTICSLFF
jgi:hypothetical protein